MSETTDLLKKIIRTEPIQQRSSARITLLLDAAAEIISEHGIEGLTTSDVATKSKSSVGVVYRYFPNIRSLLQALAARNMGRFIERLEVAIPPDAARWVGGLDTAIDCYVDMMRSEPGFRAIRFGDIIDDRLLEPDVNRGGMLSQLFMSLLTDHYGITRSDDLMFRLEVAVEVSDALLKRAFQHDPVGDERFIERSRDLVRAELALVSA